MAQLTFSVDKQAMGRVDMAAVVIGSGSSIGTNVVSVTIDTANAEAHGNGAADGVATGKAAVIKALDAIRRKLLQNRDWPPTAGT